LNFDNAIKMHEEWKIRLLAAINGIGKEEFDLQTIGSDAQCSLGQWIHGEAKQYSHLPEYLMLVREHANFHVCAAEVLRLASSGRTEMARMHMTSSGPFMDASTHTIDAIKQLRNKVANP